MNKSYIFSLITLLLISCNLSSKLKQNSPFGEDITLELKDSTTIIAELISITDSSIFVHKFYTYQEINNNQIDELSLDNLYRPGTKIFFGGLLLIIEGLMASTDSDSNLEFGLLIPPTIYAFLINNPKTSFQFPIDESTKNDLKKYSRYPAGISDKQLQLLKSGSVMEK